MRGVYTSVTDIRRKVFTETARLAYEKKDYESLNSIPYKIISGETGTYRDSVFLERAIVGERLRLAMGLPLRKANEQSLVSDGVDEILKSGKLSTPPLVNIIKFACNACPESHVRVTDSCCNCLAHPCTLVCPTKAVYLEGGHSNVDTEKCIKCGRCISACPYNAIISMPRPCAASCGVDAIGSDEHGRAEIDYEKCVSCGMCIVNCPFGAISDKGQLFQLITAITDGKKVVAAVAPSFHGQFGRHLSPEKLNAAMQLLGFDRVVEVAIGADLCTIDEGQDFLKKVPDELPFMATSCCPAWSVMAKQFYPDFAECVSMSLTPMVFTARLIKKRFPDCLVAFIGPCTAKKLEAGRKSVKSCVDFVLTYEELMGMFEAKKIDITKIESNVPLNEATGAGRGYAVSGGVAKAVSNVIQRLNSEIEVKTASAQSLSECRKMLDIAKSGKYNGFLLEGMACTGGCIGGAGTLQPLSKAEAMIKKYASDAERQNALDSDFREYSEDGKV